MSAHTSSHYLAYKRDTSRLLYWVIRASNSINRSSKQTKNGASEADSVNTTGQVTVSGLVSMSKLIAKHVNAVPGAIYLLFQSVISARTSAYTAFQKFQEQNPDEEIRKSNAAHKHFIDALTEAFNVLGGEAWATEEPSHDDKPGQGPEDDSEDVDLVLFSNRFDALGIKDAEEDEESDAEEDEVQKPAAPSRRRQQPKPGKGKGKKAKRGKKGTRKPARDVDLENVPLESYRIIEDESGLVTDYLMAVYALVSEWTDLRAYLQGLWHDVAYGGLNSAVAGTVSNLSIAMIQRSESAMFVDFPGHESYETVMKTITRGDPEKARGMFTVGLVKLDSNGTSENGQDQPIDIKEQFLIHAYQDLIDFVVDFQKNRTGKPTKQMSKEIGDWDPNFDVQTANEEQRLKWRRSYTINWLYDLVNLFSSIVVQRNNLKEEKHAYEDVDWSTTGPWNQHRRIFGLSEFAGFVTTLAMQKPSTDIRHRILPHHVFQLQSIVDSMTVSRGWSMSGLKGHVLEAPAQKFRPRRDVDLFLDRENKHLGRGFLRGVEVLKQLLQTDGKLHKDRNRHKGLVGVLDALKGEFVNWLGESMYMNGLKSIPPSRFSGTNANGLWEYSPFLCGVGLTEGLELSYRVGHFVWDKLPEVALVLHLHNMLLQKGYLKRPVSLYATLQHLFPTVFFVDGKPPTKAFHKALLARTGDDSSRKIFKRQREAAKQTSDVHSMIDLDANHIFTAKSNLSLYRSAHWNPARIADKNVHPSSMLGCLRLGQTKRVVDKATGETRLESTDLVDRAKALGMTDETLLGMASGLEKLNEPEDVSEEDKDQLKEDGNAALTKGDLRKKKGKPEEPSGRDILVLLGIDVFRDVCGQDMPLSSFNYIFGAATMLMLFEKMEKSLDKARNSTYVRAYETDQQWRGNKRVGLAWLALMEQDDECLRIMAKEFEGLNSGFMNFVYWDQLRDTAEWLKDKGEDDEPHDKCVVM